MTRTLLWGAVALVAVTAFFLWLPEPAAPQPGAWPAQDGNAFVLRDVRVFDGTKPVERVDVLVEGGIITAVGSRVPVPRGTVEYAADGHMLLPAFLDAHTHNFMNSRVDALRFGVGTQVDMFSDHRVLAAAHARRVSLEPSDEADMWSAGMLVTAAGGHGTQFGMPIPTLDSADAAAAFVAACVADGSDFIKLVLESGAAWGQEIPTLTLETLGAAIAAAHEHDKLAVVHVGTHADARAAVAAGADGLVHLFGDAVVHDALVAELLARDVFVIPTLAVLESVSGRTSGLDDDVRIRPYLTPAQTDGLARPFPGGDGRADVIVNAAHSVRALSDAGVTVLAGSDAPNPGTVHGASLHRELELLVDAGLSPADALAAATSRTADRFGIADRGRIAPGQRADLVLVAGDPLTDITATRAIVAVWKNGYRVERPRFDTGGTPPDALRDPVLGRFADGVDGWMPTTDAIQGGASAVDFDLAGGMLRIAATVRPGAPWPWAGAMRMLADAPMEPVDLTAYDALDLTLRSDGPVSVLFFSGASSQGMPQVWPLEQQHTLHTVSIPLAEVPGLDRARVRAIAVVAGPAPGDVTIDIDAVVIR